MKFRSLIIAAILLTAAAFRSADGWDAIIVPIGDRALIVSVERCCIAVGYDYRPIGNRFKFSSVHADKPRPHWMPGALNRHPGPKSVFVPVWLVFLWLATIWCSARCVGKIRTPRMVEIRLVTAKIFR